jgi:hypothetical protein
MYFTPKQNLMKGKNKLKWQYNLYHLSSHGIEEHQDELQCPVAFE